MEFGAEGDISITNLVAPTNADLTLTTSGTGNIVLDAVTVRGTTLSAADSSKITIAEALDVTGALTASSLAYPTSDGSAGHFLKTDGSGTLSFAALSLGDLTIIGSTISTPSNADLTLSPGGTGDVLLSALRVNGTTLNSSDSTKITLAEAVDITGALTSSTSLKLATGATVTGILDEDAMGTNSATQLATQQSIKAYADTKAVLTGTTNNQVTTVTGAHAFQGEGNLTFDGTTLAVSGSATISGNLTVSGEYFTTTTTNTTIEDNLLELNTGISQSLNDSGIIIERGSTGDNAGIIWG